LGDVVQPMDAQLVKEWLRGLEIPEEAYNRELEALPDSCKHGEELPKTTAQQVASSLFDNGMARGSINALLERMDDLVRIADWYQRKKEHPSEHETVAHLVVPLLRALGWTPQKMALEWNRMDIALFSGMPRKDDRLAIVVEAKRIGSSCLRAKGQAAKLAEKRGREPCARLIVTDGLRYGVYVREHGGRFRDDPEAYLNLTRMMRSYPIIGCGGAKDALRMMAADWRGQVA